MRCAKGFAIGKGRDPGVLGTGAEEGPAEEVDEDAELLGSEDEDAEKIVSRHIKLLHRYNEAKDAAQV